jgi:predicted nucleic acid-binding protein
MRIDCFLDTNVLVYAAIGKHDEPERHAIARDLVLTQKFGVSAQTLAEFYVAVRRKAKTPLSVVETDHWIDELSSLPNTVVDEEIVREGIFLSRKYGLKYYDAALLAAAARLGADIFYSEDLNHGQNYGSVKVINPFKAH